MKPRIRTDNLVTTRHSRTDNSLTTRHSHGHSHGSGPTLAATPSLCVGEKWVKVEIMEVDFIEDVFTHTTVMSEKEMNDLPVTRHLGEGSFGTVDLVTFRGRDAIRKAIKNGGDLTGFLWEAHVTLEVDGAGGAPRLHALSTEPASAIMDYAGVPLYRILNGGCPMGTFLRIVAGVAKSLGRVHAKGFIHNDIKNDNITVTGTALNPLVHVIDFGLATRVNESFYFELFDLPRSLEKQEYIVFRSPELKKGEPLQPSSDVFSIGVMLRHVCEDMKHQRLNELLWPLVEACTKERPEDRPSLRKVWQDVQDMVSILTDKEDKHILGSKDENESGDQAPAKDKDSTTSSSPLSTSPIIQMPSSLPYPTPTSFPISSTFPHSTPPIIHTHSSLPYPTLPSFPTSSTFPHSTPPIIHTPSSLSHFTPPSSPIIHIPSS